MNLKKLTKLRSHLKTYLKRKIKIESQISQNCINLGTNYELETNS
jgi:hypothetical protein